MAEQIQEFIDKIKQEGIQQADQKAKEIEDGARKKAEQIIEQAQSKADNLLNQAKEQIKQMEDTTRLALEQACRDTLLSLRNEIQQTLQKVISAQLNETLTSENLLILLEKVIEIALQNEIAPKDMQVDLDSENFNVVKEGIIKKFQKRLKEPFSIRASEDIGKGFTISFDSGKSNFDFTDESLAEYLMMYLSPQVAALLEPKADKA